MFSFARRIWPVAMLFLAISVAACAPAGSTGSSNPASAPAAIAPAQAPTAASAPTQAAANQPASGGQTYTVQVGWEDTSNGVEIEGYFPSTLHIHVGDTVHWKLNAKEIHTVTFSDNGKLPDLLVPVPNGPQGAMMFNPQVAFPPPGQSPQFDGTRPANSGLMGPDQGQATDLTLTFIKAGTYNYACAVHVAEKMVGSIVVEEASAQVPSPAEAEQQGQQELDALRSQVAPAMQAAQADIKPAEKNADGTMTYHVNIGYTKGQIDLMSYFPNKINAHPGDTVVYDLGKADVAPHTVTFLNGEDEPQLVSPQPQPNGPPLLALNPKAAQPLNAGQLLTAKGIYSSGMLAPGTPGPQSFQFKIGDTSGDLQFECILHNDAGMLGTLSVAK